MKFQVIKKQYVMLITLVVVSIALMSFTNKVVANINIVDEQHMYYVVSSTSTAQVSNDLMQISSVLSKIVSTRSFFDSEPGVSAQQEWLQAGCEVNFTMVAAKAGSKVLVEFHFKLADIGNVTVNPTGTGGFTVKISSSDGTARIPKILEVWKQGVVTLRQPTYSTFIEFKLSNRDDAYRVSELLRTAIAACQ